MADQVSFTRMADGTREDYVLVVKAERGYGEGLGDRLLAELVRSGDVPGPWKVTRYEHALQTATRALRDGADEETCVIALLHDVGDALAPANHSEFAASALRPYVSERNHWIVKHHGLFQGYYYFHHLGMDRHARDRYADNPHYDATVAFCEEWDQAAFDPSYESEPIEVFAPMVREVFSREPNFNFE